MTDEQILRFIKGTKDIKNLDLSLFPMLIITAFRLGHEQGWQLDQDTSITDDHEKSYNSNFWNKN